MNSKNSSFLIFLGIIITGFLIAGAIVYTNKEPSSSEEMAFGEEKTLPEDSGRVAAAEGDNIRGDVNAPVVVVEFSDFQCPFCSRFHPTVQQIVNDYSGQVRWVYKHFPLDQIHLQARPAAEASECAAEQGKFWEFSDHLFKNQARLGQNLYTDLAQSLGFNMEQFEDCVLTRKYKDKIEAHYQEGLRAGVRGTPASFINGKLVSGAVSYETLKAAVEEVLSGL